MYSCLATRASGTCLGLLLTGHARWNADQLQSQHALRRFPCVQARPQHTEARGDRFYKVHYNVHTHSSLCSSICHSHNDQHTVAVHPSGHPNLHTTVIVIFIDVVLELQDPLTAAELGLISVAAVRILCMM